MSEKIAIECLCCDFAAIVKTPDTQEGLVNMIVGLNDRHECGNMKIVQRSWVNDYGIFGGIEH